MKNIVIMDTTLRDGEQTKGVCFTPDEKLLITKILIEKCNVERVEIASCKVSDVEQNSITQIMDWAIDNGHENKIEVLSFVDGSISLDWLLPTRCKRVNLLVKGSKDHCENQLNKSFGEHVNDIAMTLQYASNNNFNVAVYLEDWSRGIKNNPEYVFDMIKFLESKNIKSIHLCDTLGILNPSMVKEYIGQCCSKFPNINFEFHAHNDYGLATANSFAAIDAGASALHVTVNGLGERAGNTSLSEIAVGLKDFNIANTSINEDGLIELSRICETYSQKKISENTPIVGNNVFTHVAGVHADGQSKGDLYETKLNPKRFGRSWEYALGKLSGKQSLQQNLNSKIKDDLSMSEQKILLAQITNLNEQKINITDNILSSLIKEIKS